MSHEVEGIAYNRLEALWSQVEVPCQYGLYGTLLTSLAGMERAVSIKSLETGFMWKLPNPVSSPVCALWLFLKEV